MIISKYEIISNGINFKLLLKDNLVLVDGFSGIGKSMLFRTIRAKANTNADATNILCINKDDIKGKSIENIRYLINTSKNKFIVIDNAEIVLDYELRNKISIDTENQYLVFSHTTDGFIPVKKSICTLVVEGKNGYLKYNFV